MIQLYNSRTRRKEAFAPLDPANVRMYVCGPTVYDRAHIGNARPVVVFDVLYRLLRHEFGADRVTYVRNFTDVDDKIIARAQETLAPGETLEGACRRITDETIGWYREDMDALGALRPTHEPRCTEYIPQMVDMTAELIAKGHAYEAEGHVLFAVDSFERYGALSGRTTDDMLAGARVEVAPYKRSPMDFVMWKPSTPEQPGWDSPWGRGRPGWHIECSAMARALLGEVFDIHGGGIDLQFPHHENELAQSRCAHGTELMAQVWMHNGFLQVEGEKMAKSAGNFFTVKDLRDRGIPGEVIRFVLLSTRYRQPLDWTEKRVERARQTLDRWYSLIGDIETYPNQQLGGADFTKVTAALSDDLNSPLAIKHLHHWASVTAEDGTAQSARRLKSSAMLLGLLEKKESQWKIENAQQENVETLQKIDALLTARQAARKEKDFTASDSIRDDLRAIGIEINDRGDHSDWLLDGVEHVHLYRAALRTDDPDKIETVRQRAKNAGVHFAPGADELSPAWRTKPQSVSHLATAVDQIWERWAAP